MRRQITSLIRPQMLLIQALGLLALGVLILVRPYDIEAVISRILAVALCLNAVLSIITLLSAPDEPDAEPLEEEFRPGLAARIGRSGRAFMNFLRAQEGQTVQNPRRAGLSRGETAPLRLQSSEGRAARAHKK